MFTNQLYQSTKKHQVEEQSLLKSLLTPYLISGIPFGSKKQKPSKHSVSRVLTWAQMDSNHRPSDYESAGFITSLPLISAFSAFRYTLGTTLIGGCSNVFNQRQEITILSNRLFC